MPKDLKSGRRGKRDSDSSGSRSPRRGKRYNKLEGKARQEAWDKGLCLGCGSPDHQIKVCPKTKRAIRRMTKDYIAKQVSKFSSSATKGTKKRRLHKLDSGKEEPPTEEEDKTETSESEEPSEEPSSEEGESGNESSEA